RNSNAVTRGGGGGSGASGASTSPTTGSSAGSRGFSAKTRNASATSAASIIAQLAGSFSNATPSTIQTSPTTLLARDDCRRRAPSHSILQPHGQLLRSRPEILSK